ncbi:MAG: sulfur carrier protein ThiS [Bacillota bacterium]
MKLQVNGRETILDKTMTVREFILSRDLDPNLVAVMHNSGILPKEDWDSTVLKENDELEVLRFVGGG